MKCCLPPLHSQLEMMISAWSCQGLIAHYSNDKLMLIDQTVSFIDPFYCQILKLKFDESVSLLQWNSNGSLLLVASKSGSIELFRQVVS